MENAQFTAGPWHVGSRTRIIGANSQRIAVADDTEVTSGIANSRLIAAAPELLDALLGAMFFVPVGTLARDRADEAIAKARGE